jgi:hypothetical protein
VTVGLLALVPMMAVMPCFAAQRVETPRIGIGPAHESDYFHIALTPGGRTTNTAVVSNYSDQTARVRIYAADGGTSPQGQFALNGDAEPRDALGAWIVPSVSELTLAPQSSVPVDFVLTVPPNTSPGDYAGGIVLEGEPHPGPTQDAGNETAVQLTIVERLGVRVYLKVDGEAKAHLAAGRFSSERVAGGAIEFSFELHNDGNVKLSPTGVVTLKGLGLSGPPIALSQPELLLPGTSTTVRGRWERPALYALGHAEAVVTYGNGQTTDASVGVRLIPFTLTALLALLAVVFAYVAYRLTRFIRRARVALRTLNPKAPSLAH